MRWPSINHTPSRPRRAANGPRRITCAASVIIATLLVAGAANARPQRDPTAPGGPQGAWAGYSIGNRPEPVAPRGLPTGTVSGMDVSGHQGKVDWKRAQAAGAHFAYVKATEGKDFRSDAFPEQYQGASSSGLIHGAYHFALPDRSSGAAQANFFLRNGGAWSADGHTLPGALDIERNPYGPVCYGMDPHQMSSWIAEFSTTYQQRTGRFPAFYTTTNWWNRCTGSNPDFAANNPLWIARHAQEMGALPAGWKAHTLWQFSDRGVLPGDQNTFNGGLKKLSEFTW